MSINKQSISDFGFTNSQKGLSICFIHTPCLSLRDDRLEPPLGLLYVATLAQSKGYYVKLIDLSAKETPDLGKFIPDDFDVYGFSTYSVNYGLTLELVREVRKRNSHAYLIAGGPHVTALPYEAIHDGFDTIVTGEGEIAVLQILQMLEAGKQPPNIVNGIAPSPLDELPFPDYGLIDFSTYTRQVAGKRCVSILSSRGCPYPCSFCNSNIMGAGKAIRFRSPENVAQEIRQVKENLGVHNFRFQDDIFTLSIKRVREIAPWLAKENIVYRCFARVNTFSEEMAQLLKESGCVHASFGVESGSPKLLANHAMAKKQTPKQIVQALENAHKHGITSRIFLIVGFPGETEETIEETLALMKSCPWDEFSVYPLIAYPGTPLHDRPEDYGITYIDKNYSDYLQIGKNFKAGFTIRTNDFDEHRVREWRDYVIDELLADGRTWAGNSLKFK